MYKSLKRAVASVQGVVIKSKSTGNIYSYYLE